MSETNQTPKDQATPPTSAPPAWAESVLRLVLEPQHRESVSGDLLEEYRESVLPTRGRSDADVWYVRQVVGFVWRATWWWGVLMALAGITRDAVDWFLPAETFYARSMATTFAAIALFLAAGFWTAWHKRSLRAGVLAGLATSLISALLSIAGSLVMLGIWHDQRTLSAIAGSGGLGEVFELPILIAVPGVILATLGGATGKAAASLFRSRARG